MGVAKSLEGIRREDKAKKCPECGSEQLEYDGGELYCKKCGLVID
jgi:ribosomal protein L37AE/L43A